MKRSLLALSLLSPLLFSGCKSGIDTARNKSEPLVEAACGWMFSCCTADELVYQVGDFTVTPDNCSERLLDAIEAGVPLDLEQPGLSADPAQGLLLLALSINEERVKVNSDMVEGCAAATRARTCNIPVEPGGRCTPGALVPDDPCDPDLMFEGKQKVGEACETDWECATDLRCINIGFSTGVCAQRSPLGENCFEDAECAEDLICDWNSGTCATGAGLGQICAFSDPLNPIPGTESVRCEPGLSCDPVNLTCTGGYCAPGANCFDVFNDLDCPESYFCIGNSFIQPTCQNPVGDGSPCSKDLDCTSGYCDPFNEICGSLLANGDNCFDSSECDSGFCDQNMGTCAATVPSGQPCPSFDNDECTGGYCDTTDPTMPTCVGYAGAGDACPNGNECDPDAMLFCVDGSCLQAPFPNGTSCFSGNECVSEICYNGMCADGLTPGTACATDGSTAPCIVGAFCETPAGDVNGSCAALRRSGEPCENSQQCWGECVVRYGELMCDGTPAYALGEQWCDGPL